MILTNVWIKAEEKAQVREAEPAVHRGTVHYTVRNGNSQHQLQLLASDIIEYGKHIGDTRHYGYEISLNGEQRAIGQGARSRKS